jgi:hypothetical protein
LNAANNAQTLLVGAITDTDTVMTVLDGSIFPEPPFLVTVEDEIIEVRAKTGNVFGSLLRGQEGTVAVAHADGVEVQNRMTVGMYDSLALQEDVTDLAGTGRTIETVKGNADDLAAHLAEKASQSTLGHIKIGPAGSIDINGVYTPGGFKRVNATHDISVAGDQIINGVGFTPRAIIAFACVAGTSAASMGIHSGSSYSIVSDHVNIANAWSQGTGTLIELKPVAATIGYATVKSIDSDGCTLTWEKSGSPTGTAIFTLLFLK